MKLGGYTLPKEDPKNMNHVKHHLNSADISIFSSEIKKFFNIRKYRYTLHFGTYFLILLTFFESLINMITIFMMSAKLATPGLLKIKIFQNKGYEVIILGYDVTNRIFSRDSNYTVDVVM